MNFSEAPVSPLPPRQRAQDGEEHLDPRDPVSESGHTGTSYDTIAQNDATLHAPIEPMPVEYDLDWDWDWDMFENYSAPTGPPGPVFGPDYANLPGRFDTAHGPAYPNAVDLGMFQGYGAPTGAPGPVFGPDYNNLPGRFDMAHGSPPYNDVNQLNAAYGPQHYTNHPNPWGLVWGQQRYPVQPNHLGMVHEQQQRYPVHQNHLGMAPAQQQHAVQPNQLGRDVHRWNEQQLANSLGMGPQGYTTQTRDRVHTWTRNVQGLVQHGGSDGAGSTTLCSVDRTEHAT